MEIKFNKIADEHSPYFSLFEERYLSDFPEVERREISMVISLLQEPESPFTIEAILKEHQFVGFISYWQLSEFIFLEHFAIRPEVRSQGIGEQVLQQIQSRFHDRKMLLEVELPTDKIAHRRIQFYQRMGFELSDIPYIQPPYRRGGETCPLKLMTLGFGREVMDADLQLLREFAYQLE